MSAFKYEQLLLKQILDAFPVKVLFMRQACLPGTAVRSHTERIKEEKDAAQLAATTTGCGCRRMSRPGTTRHRPVGSDSSRLPAGGRIDRAPLSV